MPPQFTHLSTEDCQALLATCVLGRIAFAAGDSLQLVPINCRYVDGGIYVRTSPTSLLGVTARNRSPVVFEVDHIELLLQRGWSVLARGTARVDTTRPPTDTALLGLRAWAPGERDLLVRIDIDELSGRRVSPR